MMATTLIADRDGSRRGSPTTSYQALGVVTEDQPDIADALLAIGATLRLETMHMRRAL